MFGLHETFDLISAHHSILLLFVEFISLLKFKARFDTKNGVYQEWRFTIRCHGSHWVKCGLPLSSTWPYLNSAVGLEEGEY